MCIAIVSPGDQALLPLDEFNESMRSNPDGMGLAFVIDGKFRVAKSLSDGKAMYRIYKWAHEKGLTVVLHFRRATHGEVCVENCHPFVHSDTELFVHNGVLNFHQLPKDEVDSKAFSYRILEHMPNNWRELPDIRKMLENYLSGSKIVILDVDSNVTILNEKSGIMHEKRWYSNSSFRTYNSKRHKSAYGAYNGKYSAGFGYGEWFAQQNSKGKAEDLFDDPITVDDKEVEQIDLSDTVQHSVPEGMEREVVTQEDDMYDHYPHGFDYQGYEICSFCVPSELVVDATTIPLWLDVDEDFICESCSVWMSKSSPKRYTLPFDRATELPLIDDVEAWLLNGSLEDEEAERHMVNDNA